MNTHNFNPSFFQIGKKTIVAIGILIMIVSMFPNLLIDENSALPEHLSRIQEASLDGISQDAYVNEFANDTNYGSDSELFVGGIPGETDIIETYIQFNLTHFSPPGGFYRVYLEFYMWGQNGAVNYDDDFRVHPVLESWNESEITWNHRPMTGSAMHSNPGMDYQAKYDQFHRIEITNIFALWKSGEVENNGLMMESAENYGYIYLRSMDHVNESQRPRLAIQTVSPAMDDTLENNDDQSSAVEISDGGLESDLKLLPGDPDWYKIARTSQNHLILNSTFNCNYQFQVEVWNATALMLEKDGIYASGNLDLAFPIPETDTSSWYYVKFDTPSSLPLNYTLRVELQNYLIDPPLFKDGYTDALQPESNFGNEMNLYAGGDPSHENGWKEAYLQLDLEAYQNTTPYYRVNLKLYMTGQNGWLGDDDFRVHPVLEAWNDTEITWQNRPAVGEVVHTHPGTSFDGCFNLWHSLEITSLYHKWITEKQENFGLMIESMDNYGYIYFASFEYPDSNYHPHLEIVPLTEPFDDEFEENDLQPDSQVLPQGIHDLIWSDPDWFSISVPDIYFQLKINMSFIPTSDVNLQISLYGQNTQGGLDMLQSGTDFGTYKTIDYSTPTEYNIFYVSIDNIAFSPDRFIWYKLEYRKVIAGVPIIQTLQQFETSLFNSSDSFFRWKVSHQDFQSGDYVIFVDNFQTAQGTWHVDNPIEFYVGDLNPGSHTIQIQVSDAVGHQTIETYSFEILSTDDTDSSSVSSISSKTDNNPFADFDIPAYPLFVLLGLSVMSLFILHKKMRID